METKTADATDPATKHESNPRKRVRHRKKQLYENVMKQMEFYFSDANLSKDRFLGDLVKNDPFVPLSEFLKFNKIRSMTKDVNDIVKAMKHSTFLELSEDKLKVSTSLYNTLKEAANLYGHHHIKLCRFSKYSLFHFSYGAGKSNFSSCYFYSNIIVGLWK